MDYINLNHSFFKIEPDIIFSKSMKVPLGVWNDLFKRHNFWDYKQEDLVEWFEFKYRKPISQKTIYRWIIRQEIYNDAQRAIKEGSYKVNINFFPRHKEIVIKYKI